MPHRATARRRLPTCGRRRRRRGPPSCLQSPSTRPESAGSVDLAGADPALLKADGPQSFTGPLGAGQEVLFAESRTGRWDLKVAGKKAAHGTAFGWANAYTVGADGTGSLHY